MILGDTIAAVATARGPGGIGIIRISGPEAEGILRRIFRPRREGPLPMESHRLHLGRVVAPEPETVLDEVLATIMKAPHSYTGEDVAEIHCHGGVLLLERILSEVVRSGARPAGPGEFTRRAFLNDRISLAQAEAVWDLINGKTEKGLDIALSHLEGALSDRVQYLRYNLTEALALAETSIDFCDEDVSMDPATNVPRILEHCMETASALLSTYREGKIWRDGLSLVIAGKPNAGKSSLLNRLLGEERAIVSTRPGTTRDFIEEGITIRGIPVRLTDTAGIRQGRDDIEEEGIRRVWSRIAACDAVLVLLDGSVPLSAEDREIIAGTREKKTLLCINKVDLPGVLDREALRALLPECPPLEISAKFGTGIPELREAVYGIAALEETRDMTADRILTNLRHKEALERALRCLERGREAVAQGMSPECFALELREALDALGEITGETTNEEILDRIFSRFCIGK